MSNSELIYPYLKRIYPEDVDEFHLEGGNELINRPFNDNAIITYVIDRGEQYGYVQQRYLDSNGLTADEVHLQSLENFRKLRITLRDSRSMKVVLVNGNLESTLLLIDGFWDLI